MTNHKHSWKVPFHISLGFPRQHQEDQGWINANFCCIFLLVSSFWCILLKDDCTNLKRRSTSDTELKGSIQQVHYSDLERPNFGWILERITVLECSEHSRNHLIYIYPFNDTRHSFCLTVLGRRKCMWDDSNAIINIPIWIHSFWAHMPLRNRMPFNGCSCNGPTFCN